MKASHVVRFITCTVGLVLVAAGCTETNTETIFVDRPLFDDPPAAASGFLGYGTADAQAEGFTVCGNCHIGKQSEWELTHHADAWNTLQNSGHAQPFCEGCHAVSENGNAAEGDVGWVATADTRYYDVQCESCHGPGSGHVSNPGAAQPLASIAVDLDLTSGCGECHQGSHHGFVDEWLQSRHGPIESNAGARDRGGSCASCHEARGALLALGETAPFVEKDGVANLPIVCSVCHDPHNATNEHQLRFPVDVPDVNNNLCMKCHQRRAVPEVDNSRGPHSPQGPLLLGEDVGWIPPNFNTNIVRGTHGSAQNEKLCVTCHLHARDITDPVSGDFVFSSKGHLFKPIPCLDPQGVPVGTDCDVSERSFASCTGAGCHGDETVARSLYLVSTGRIAAAVADLAAQLAQVPATEFDTEDGILTVAEGATFNQKLGEITSSAIHNPFLTEALLLGSMVAVENEYGIAPRILPSEMAARWSEIGR
ncbi:MAG: multiheme c-type cytochrome [Gemmatimonadota bacterium]|nr:multiheme c-type cytochrome [Gemmatimonadota bacterium]MDH3427804.1 multiheme c-type cytochrome [Gemmatimonadota bacterium]